LAFVQLTLTYRSIVPLSDSIQSAHAQEAPKMRCFCTIHNNQPIELIYRDIPKPQGSEVLVRVKAAGMCHSDLHIWEGYYELGPGKRLMLKDRGMKLPLIMGHEICGEVVDVGSQAQQQVQLGMKAIIHPWIGCGQCAVCQAGNENLCNVKAQSIGIMRDGGFADYVIVPHPRYLVDLGTLDPAKAAPLACAGVTTYSAIRKFGARIHQGPVVVIGAGGLGLMTIQVVKALGGRGVVAVDINEAKRQAALKEGALAVVDASTDNAVEQVIQATGGGALAVLDLVGSTASMMLAMNASARGGHIVIVGLMGGEVTLGLPLLPIRALSIQGNYVGTLSELRELVALMQEGKISPVPVTTRPMAEVNQALLDLQQGKVIGRQVMVV
jgi:propanol-preferring alcohol dehydrogenase